MMYSLPPLKQGSEREYLRQLNDYLQRAFMQLDKSLQALSEGSEANAQEAEKSAVRSAKDMTEDNEKNIKALIIKTADDVKNYADVIRTVLESSYVANSTFGTYQQEVTRQIEETAQATTESFLNSETITSINSQLGTLETFATDMSGQIKRGYITVNGITEFGIAISQSISYTTEKQIVAGNEYTEIAPGQTFGLYTSTGWEFWINGSKVGWFDSLDSSLHVANIVVEDKMQMGADWLITTSGGFGIRYIG